MDNGKNVALVDKPSPSRVIKANRKTVTAKWNAEMLRGLEAALRKNLEADLTALLPSTYLEKLQSLQRDGAQQTRPPNPRPIFPARDIRSRLAVTDPCTIIFGLSTELEGLFQKCGNLSGAIVDLLAESEVLYESAWTASVMVFRVSKEIVVKITTEEYAVTEYSSLLYLREHIPGFPAARPHGLVRFGIFCLLFTTFIPGLDLEKVWPELGDTQKRNISSRLDVLFSELRTIPFPDNSPLGGIEGEGCKDARRGLRVNSEPIMNAKQFEDFIFAGSKTASPLYTQLLRDLVPADVVKCVFTHGDVRPANIMVDKDESGTWKVVSIIDWERSGFYPEYWECVKITNSLTPRDHFDWYRYLPKCLSPSRYPVYWLLDRVWDRSMMNC